MRKQVLRFAVAVMTFALGVVGSFLWDTADDAAVNVPGPPMSVQLVAPSVEQAKTCEIHGVVMHLECVPRNLLAAHSSTLAEEWATKNLFPNSTDWPLHLTKSPCKVNKEVGVLAFVCPECRKAQSKWEQRK